MPTPFTEALSTLNDRALRRLLGARAFLRGYDYVRGYPEVLRLEKKVDPAAVEAFAAASPLASLVVMLASLAFA